MDKTLNITIGIPSYNESYNLVRILHQVLSQRLPRNFKISEIIVSDDSTDDTPLLINKLREKRSDDKISFLHHNTRRGVSEAWNEIFQNADGDIVVLYDADISITKDTTYNLVKRFAQKKELGIIASSPRPYFSSSIAGRASCCVGEWLRFIRILCPDSQFTVMGRGLAIRGFLAKKIKIPKEVIACDLYLACKVYEMGFKVSYADDAIIFFKPAESMRDFASQVIRAFIGHRQLKNVMKNNIPSEISLKEQLGPFLKVASGSISNLLSTIIAYSALLVYFPIVFRGSCTTAWETAKTTK